MLRFPDRGADPCQQLRHVDRVLRGALAQVRERRTLNLAEQERGAFQFGLAGCRRPPKRPEVKVPASPVICTKSVT